MNPYERTNNILTVFTKEMIEFVNDGSITMKNIYGND